MDKNIKFSLNKQRKEKFSKNDFVASRFSCTNQDVDSNSVEGTNNYTFI